MQSPTIPCGEISQVVQVVQIVVTAAQSVLIAYLVATRTRKDRLDSHRWSNIKGRRLEQVDIDREPLMRDSGEQEANRKG